MRPAPSRVRKGPSHRLGQGDARLRNSETPKRTPAEIKELAHDLEGRKKELRCLYELNAIIETPDIVVEDILQRTANLLPSALQYPEIACTRIVLDGGEYRTSNFEVAKRRLCAEMSVSENAIGQVEVGYLPGGSTAEAAPFLEEERSLISAVAERLSRVVERKRAETALREKVEDLRRLTTVVSDSNDAVIMHDFDGKILAWNRGAQETYGYTEVEALGWNVREIVAEPDREAALSLIQSIKEGKVVKSFELRRLAKDGRVLDVWLTTTLLRDESGKPVAIATTERDITERKQTEETIRRSADVLLRTGQIASVGGWELDLLATKLFWTPQTYRIHETDPSFQPDLETAINFYAPEARPIIGEAVRRASEDGTPWDLELPFITAKGRHIWVRAIGEAELRDGKCVRLSGAFQDITERKRAETALQQKMEDLRRLATVVSDSNDAVIMHDFDGKILAWNRGAKEMYGYLEAEALGKNVREIVAEPDREAALSLIQSIKEGKVVKSFELRRLAKDGRVLDVWLTTTLLRDEAGQPVAIATTERDITERKRAETALREKVEDLRRLATVVSDSNDAVIMHDFDGKILAWNRGAQETYGYTEVEALGWNVREIVAEPDREAALSLIHSIKEGKVVKSFELRRLAKDGRVLDVWLTTTLLRDEAGQPVAIATTERDITERKRAEEEIRALNAGLEQRVGERTAQLEAANKELEAFSYSVSHDLRAPLRAIDGFSRILIDDYAASLPAEASRYLALVRSNTQIMGELVDDLLAFSRLSQQPLRKQSVRTADVARAALEALRAEQDGREIEVVIGDLPACEGDAAMLKQVYLNLLGNAIKFTRQRPVAQIEAGWEEQAGVPVYFVRDNGVGFDMRYVDKLFGVFQRLHRSDEYEGTGVGLAIVQRIVKRHGGRAWAEAELGQGATFYFTLSGGPA